ncbi:hypothetical protein [Chloracidobacterium thermophilum]|uniref:hypothetical protein n=1 Tax=Chloracidobacterium thermophilum TaxID=458033 RepID=UPI0012FECEF3|nr:hypothetical protein [Chloracidobacterium thermophilum]
MTQPSDVPPMASNPSEGASAPALDWATAEDAYHLVNALLSQVTAANELIVLLATLLGEASLKRVVETHQWVQYQSSRRHMESLQADLERFAATMQRLAAAQPDRPADCPEEETGAPPDDAT